MRVIIQRVSEANVTIANQIKSKIGVGFMILLGIEHADTDKDIEWLTNKICGLRVFSDENDKMNLSIKDIDGEILVVSQFTLHAGYKKGNRPSFIKAAPPKMAISMYEKFVSTLEEKLGKPIQTGTFGAMMQVSLTNDGPVTIFMDSQRPE